MRHRPEIDGLRAIAVIPVILFHAGFTMFGGGFVGVDVFFVISGYLITGIILSDISQGKFSVIGFYERRARRILPALFFVIGACVPFAWLLFTPGDMKDFAESVVAVSLFSSNFLFWLEAGYFEAPAALKPLLHTWSLAVEEQYYILFPLFLLLTWRFGKLCVVAILAVAFAASLAWAHWAAYNAPVAAFYLLPARGWEILLGAFAAFFSRHEAIVANKTTNDGLAVLGLGLIAYAIFAFDELTPFPSLYALVPAGGALLIILCAQPGTLIQQIVGNRLFVGIGLISYSAYLWHQPLFAFVKYYSLEAPSVLVMALLCGLTIPLAYLTWRFVEQPFRQKHIFSRTFVFGSAAALGSLLIAAGLIGHFNDGYRQRFGKDELLVLDGFDDAQTERGIVMRAGTCHYGGRGRFDRFLDAWSCYSNDEGLLDSNVLIFGDSHSADKAAAFRLNGIDVTQVGGADCPLAPSHITIFKAYCRALMEKAHEVGAGKRLVLANRFLEEEISADYLSEIMDYWSKRHEEVILFSPMPDFTSQLKELLSRRTTTYPPSLAREELFFQELRKIAIPSNVHIVRTSEVFAERRSEMG